ncbi:MAG: hypothetical protein AB4426_16015 [Xenococcaceae cyanobacterium]
MAKIKFDDIFHEHPDPQLLEKLSRSQQQQISGGNVIRGTTTLVPNGPVIPFVPGTGRSSGGNFLTAANC